MSGAYGDRDVNNWSLRTNNVRLINKSIFKARKELSCSFSSSQRTDSFLGNLTKPLSIFLAFLLILLTCLLTRSRALMRVTLLITEPRQPFHHRATKTWP